MSESLLHSILDGQRQAVTYCHPIYGLKSGLVEAREMLTRFKSTEGQMVTVGHLLEDLTLSPELRTRLDLLCIGSVFRALAESPITEGLIFVNLNPPTLDSPEFWRLLRPWIWDLTIPPHRIVIEITEGHAQFDLDQLEHYAHRLREHELRIAVDDLGSGVASLSHMARLAPDFLKVDQSLVRNAHRRPYQAALLNALALFSERMRVGCIAEGIETAEELEAVIDADVPWGQGFIFGEPQPLAAQSTEL